MANGLPKNAGPKFPVIAAVALVAGLGGGYVLGWSTPRPTPKVPTYEEGFADAKKKMEDAGILPREMPEVKEMNGTIVEVKATSFVFKPDGQAINPLVGAPETREVMVTDGTAITMEVPKDPAVYAKETAAFKAELSKAGTHEEGTKPFPVAPLATEMKEVALKDLKAGGTARVTAAEDVKMAATFTATSVFVYGGLFGNAPPPKMEVPPEDRTNVPPNDLSQPDVVGEHPPSAPEPGVQPGQELPRTNYVPPPSNMPEPEHPEPLTP